MLSQVLSGLTLVRHAVAITLVMGAAGATVAGAVDVSHGSTVSTNAVVSTSANKTQNETGDLEAAVKGCLATKDPASDDCAKAVALSGLSAQDFWAKVALSLNEQLGRIKNEKHDEKNEPARAPKTETVNTHELIGLVTACVATHERSSEPCRKALELSGLSADEFWAKVTVMFENRKDEPKPSPKVTEPQKTEKPRATERPKPSATPKPAQSVSDADLQSLVKDCFAKYNAAVAAKGNEDLGRAASEACSKAISASGLGADAFWAKFGRPTASN